MRLVICKVQYMMYMVVLKIGLMVQVGILKMYLKIVQCMMTFQIIFRVKILVMMINPIVVLYI